MQLLYEARYQVNTVIRKLGGDPLPADAAECWYWTSTEVENQENMKAWAFSLSAGEKHQSPKVNSYKVRPIATIYQ